MFKQITALLILFIIPRTANCATDQSSGGGKMPAMPKAEPFVHKNRKRRSSLVLVMPDLSLPPRSKTPSPSASPRASFVGDITDAAVATTTNNNSDQVVLQIDIPHIKDATPTQIEEVIDELIRQATIATFGVETHNTFYKDYLKDILRPTVTELLNPSTLAQNSDGSSHEKTTSKTTKTKTNKLLQKSQKRANTVRSTIISRITSGNTDFNNLTHAQLKEWLLRELELRELHMQDREDQATQELTNNQAQLSAERRQKIIAMIISGGLTLLGTVGTGLLTYFATRNNSH